MPSNFGFLIRVPLKKRPTIPIFMLRANGFTENSPTIEKSIMTLSMGKAEGQNLLTYGVNTLFGIGALNFERMPLPGLFRFKGPDGQTRCVGFVSPNGSVCIMYGTRRKFEELVKAIGEDAVAHAIFAMQYLGARQFCRAYVFGFFCLGDEYSMATIKIDWTGGSGRAASELTKVVLPIQGLCLVPAKLPKSFKKPTNVSILRRKDACIFVDCDNYWRPIRALTAAERIVADAKVMTNSEVASLLFKSESRNSSRKVS